MFENKVDLSVVAIHLHNGPTEKNWQPAVLSASLYILY